MTPFPFDTDALCRETFGVEFRVLQLLKQSRVNHQFLAKSKTTKAME